MQAPFWSAQLLSFVLIYDAVYSSPVMVRKPSALSMVARSVGFPTFSAQVISRRNLAACVVQERLDFGFFFLLVRS